MEDEDEWSGQMLGPGARSIALLTVDASPGQVFGYITWMSSSLDNNESKIYSYPTSVRIRLNKCMRSCTVSQ